MFSNTNETLARKLDLSILTGGLTSATSYVYDNANRLTSVNVVTYTWDNNGNLLNDGVNAYTYDPACQAPILYTS